ncbi:MAG: hypothetical protein ACF8MJ_13370 [Phycisphaerales bacterium JB050]
MSHPCVLLSADLSSVMLITDSSSEVWSAPSLPESPDAMVLRSRINEADTWTAKQPAVRRKLNAAVLDITDTTCRWVQSPSAAAPVVAATLRNQTEEWANSLPLGGIEPIIDELPKERSFEFIRSRLETRKSGDRTDQTFEPTNTAATETGARMAVLIMPDALVRLWLDRMDRSGVGVDAVLSLWHALALSWGQSGDSNTVRAIVMVESESRVVWAWASGTRLIVGGSLHLERPDNSGAAPSHAHRAEAAAQRISLDWVSWSAQLGVAPDEIMMVAEASDGLAEQLLSSLGKRWEGITTRQTRSDHPLRETVARAGAAIRSIPVAERGPRTWMSRLSTRPSRATRRRYLATGLAMILIAAGIVGLGHRLGVEGDRRHEIGTTIRQQNVEMALNAVPSLDPKKGQIPWQLTLYRNELQDVEPFRNPPAPRPIYEDMLALLEFLRTEYPESKIRFLKFSQSSTNNANSLEIEFPDFETRTNAISDLENGPFRTKWARTGNLNMSSPLLKLEGQWQEDTP